MAEGALSWGWVMGWAKDVSPLVGGC